MNNAGQIGLPGSPNTIRGLQVLHRLERPAPAAERPQAPHSSVLLQKRRTLKNGQPSLIHYSSMPLFRLEQDHQTFAHILKNKDIINVGPIVDYFIRQPGHSAYRGGDAVRNLHLFGKRRKYKVLNIPAILTAPEVDTSAAVMNNIISSNDGAFSLGNTFTARKNRCDGCFRDVALARYVLDPRLEGPEKLLYPFRPSSIEIDLTTRQHFEKIFGVDPDGRARLHPRSALPSCSLPGTVRPSVRTDVTDRMALDVHPDIERAKRAGAARSRCPRSLLPDAHPADRPFPGGRGAFPPSHPARGDSACATR